VETVQYLQKRDWIRAVKSMLVIFHFYVYEVKRYESIVAKTGKVQALASVVRHAPASRPTINSLVSSRLKVQA